MKYLMIGIVTLGMLLCDTSVTEAGIFRNRSSYSNRIPRSFWSPGILIGLMGQNRGPRMVWRGDWVPAYMVR